jgi:hypothetical protein
VVDDAADGEHELFPRLWPHHFDLASLFVVERDSKGAMTKTIGVGITPPDAVDDAGYWYVSPWSKAEGDGFAKADLPLGRWVDRGAMPMAVLPVTEVWRIASEGELTKAGAVQAAAVAEFVAAAVNLCGAALSG